MNLPMIAGSLAITFAEQKLLLLPRGAIYWPATRSLVVADLHFGKGAFFRARGIPVPTGGTARDLARLAELLTATAADRLVILGDFLHARAGRQPEEMDEISSWRRRFITLDILLVRGNHDRSAGFALPEWNMHEVEEPHADGGLGLIHDPKTAAECPSLAGHVHPVFHLSDFDGAQVKIAAFVQDENRLILPAFGTFTGGHRMAAREGRRIFLDMQGRIIAVKR